MKCDVCYAPIVPEKPGYLACQECRRFLWVVLHG